MAIRNASPIKSVRPIAPKAPGLSSRTQPGTTPAPATHTGPMIRPITPGPIGAPARTVTVNPTIPTFTPGALGADAQQALGEITAKLRTLTGLDPNHVQIPGAIGSLQGERDAALRQVAMDRLRTGTNRGLGLTANDNNAAAHGVFDSGIRLHDRADTVANADMQFNNLTQQETDAIAAYKNATSAADADFARQQADITNSDTANQYQNWLNNQAIPQAPKNYQVFTKSQWLAYHRAAKTKLPTGQALNDRYNAYVAAHSQG